MSPRAIHHSYWLQKNPLQQRYESLQGTHATDVLVIGAGITGLSVADELLKRGYQVAVCEAETVGAGTTGASSGHLDAHPEMGPTRLLDRLGEDDARAYTALRLNAIQKIAQRVAEASDFVPVPGYYYTESADQQAAVRDCFDAAQRIGLRAHWVDKPPIPRALAGYQVEGLARFDSHKYARQLAEQVVASGGKIFEKTLVHSPTEKHPTSLATSEGIVHFDQLVCAVHSNFTNSLRLYFETPPYQSYCLVARVSDPPLDGLYWDDAEPYHYTRRVGGTEENLILVGGCDHRTGAGDERASQEDLEKWVRGRFITEEIVAQWSAQLFEPTDGLPLIGKVAGTENVWIATGLSGVGLTLGTAAGEILAELIHGRAASSIVKKLSPARFGLSQPTQMLSEHTTTLGNYAERVLPAERIDPSDLQPGKGAVGKVDGEFMAVCRDKQGCEHRQSPICAHMGGVVHWNEVEQTWDCPVHGGRYCADGQRLYGPPEDRLEAR